MNRDYLHFEVNTKYMYVIEYVENISNISSKIVDIFLTHEMKFVVWDLPEKYISFFLVKPNYTEIF